MFLGVTSSRRSSDRRWRRQRLRSATATARFASFWPTIWASSAATTAFGVRLSFISTFPGEASGCALQRFDRKIFVGVDAHVRRDLHCLARYDFGILLIVEQGGRRG